MVDNGKSDEIKILLGSDVYWKIQIGEKKRVYKNLFVVSLFFGWFLVGSFGEKQYSASMFKAGVSHYLTEWNISIGDCLKRFWTI